MPPDEAVARKVFLHELSRADQLVLVRELVDTRSAELCRAYPNVIDVAIGYKSKRQKKTGRRCLVRIPCVIFIVKHKWVRASEEDKDEKLPAHLFAYWRVRGKRKRCAIPTDVDDASIHIGFKPQAPGDRILVTGNGKKTFGTVTCGVHRSVFGNRPFAVSCRHVFSLSKDLHPQEVFDASIVLSTNGRVVGESIDIKGRLDDAPLLSHDAQLACVKDMTALREALGDLKLSDWARSENDVPDEYDLVVRGSRIKAKFRDFVQTSIDYKRPRARAVIHERLILSQLAVATQVGESGSPLLSRDGGLFVGMHIAGKVDDEEGPLGLAIPAWHLLDPTRYGVPPGEERWVPFNP
jgi:hypothetical protein